MITKLLNALLYQFVWFCCVLGGNSWFIVAAVAILLQLGLGRNWQNDLKMMAVFLAVGLLLDGSLQAAGVLRFTEPGWPIPLWLVAIWLALANTINHSLAWLIARPVWSAIFGAVGGPLAYWAGAKLGAATFGLEPLSAIGLLSLLWSLLFLLLSHAVKKGRITTALPRTQSPQ